MAAKVQIATDDEIKKAADLVYELTGYDLIEYWPTETKEMRELILKFGIDAVLDGIERAFEYYPFRDDAQFEYACSKIGGICFNRNIRRCKQCTNRAIGYVGCIIHGAVPNKTAETCSDYKPWYGGDCR